MVLFCAENKALQQSDDDQEQDVNHVIDSEDVALLMGISTIERPASSPRRMAHRCLSG